MNTSIDTAVIVIFSAFVLGIGLLFARTGRNLKSFFAGGEAVPWFIGGLSLFMSFFSAGTFVAWGSIAYKHGWVAITIQWTMCIGALVTGLYLAPRWKQTGALTAAEFIRERLGLTVQKAYIFIFTLVSIFIKGSVLYPVAKLVSSSLNLPLVPTTIGLGIFMIAYTAVGGLWAVMVTDILQFVVLSAAVAILLPLSLDRVGGVEGFIGNVPADFFSPLNGEYTLGFVLAFVIYHIAYIGGNWTFVQRYTSVDNPRSARKVAFLFAGLYLVAPIIWMLPPMIYRVIDPSLTGLDTENAYLKVCQLVLPPGLLGLMLTGMYFSTSASANTALNVVSAVFTNDIYKGLLNPGASDRQLIRVARGSSWVFGLGMIGIALLVPKAGGMVEVVLSISAITGGPLLAPPLWALFSKRLTGRATLGITGVGLAVNLFFKVLAPGLLQYKLSRGAETVIGVGLTLLLLLIYELYQRSRSAVADEHARYQLARRQKQREALDNTTPEDAEATAEQNRYGLKVIAGSLVFTALMLFGLSALATVGSKPTALAGGVILVAALIPWRASRLKTKVRAKAAALSLVLCCGVCTLANAQTTSLNGQWAFRTDPNEVGEEQGWFNSSVNVANWDSLPVPGNWDLRNEWANYVGKGWYRRTINVPATRRGKTIRLCFEAVYHDCTVWLNGQKLGENHSGYLPFDFDVTNTLNYGGPNTVVVCADNTFRRGAIWNWGGIRRPVTLEATDPARLVRQHITPTVDLTRRTATVTVKLLLQNHGTTAQTLRGAVRLSAPNGYGTTLPFVANVPATQTGEVSLTTTLSPQQLHLWQFDDPFLYTSTATLTTTGQTVSDRFGLRTIELDNKAYAFRLNGEAIRPMGFNLVPDDRTTGNTLPLWRIKEDVDKLKELGCTMARLTHLPLPKEALDYIDERGMLVIAELPLWGFDPLATKDHPLPTDWLNRLIERDYNHPCIIGWSVGNEIGDYPGAMSYVESAIARVRQLDPNRLAVMVSHTAARNEPEPHRRTGDPLQFSDMGLINSYGKGIGQTADKIHQRYPDKVLFYAEYGYSQFVENQDGDLDAKAMLDSLRGKPYLVGGSLWTFNDYRSAYYGTKEYSQNRPWGIVDVFRQPKRAYHSFRREIAPVRAMTVTGLTTTGATVVLTPRRTLDLPAYALTGYRLVWKVFDGQGRFREGGFRKLPTIRPGDEAIQQPVRWSPTPAGSVNIALVSPLDYSVYDTTLFNQKPQPPTILSVLGGRTEQNDPRPNTGMIRVTFKPEPTATVPTGPLGRGNRYKLRWGKGGLTNETPLTVNTYADVPKLAFGESYQVAVVAVNGAGEGEPTNVQTVRVEPDAYPAPVVQYVEPADGGFFVGYATQVDDYLVQVQYTQKSGEYTKARTVQSATKGVLFVPGLTNGDAGAGQPYYFRLRRLKDNYYPTAWTTEYAVRPDGGQLPPAPVVQGVLTQADEAIICFEPVKKATGYVLDYRASSAQAWTRLLVQTAQTGFVTVAGLKSNQSYQFRMATLNAAGQSDFLPVINVQPHAEVRRNR